MTDIELTAGDATLSVDLMGGGMRALRVGDWDVLDGYESGRAHSGRRGHVLAPWPNRIHRGSYTWRGDAYELRISDPKHESATHGLVDKIPWGIDVLSGRTVSLSVGVPAADGYPFAVVVRVTYELDESGLAVVAAADNVGTVPAPYGFGMHPYFHCAASADETIVSLPVSEQLMLDSNGAPTGEVRPFDGDLATIGDRVFDVALRRADTRSPVTIAGGLGSLTLDLGPSYRWLMLFTGDTLPEDERRRSVAIEPMTCPPGAFATGTDVITLEPGGSWTDSWSISWS